MLKPLLSYIHARYQERNAFEIRIQPQVAQEETSQEASKTWSQIMLFLVLQGRLIIDECITEK